MPGPAQVGVANVKIRADTAGFQSEAEAGVSGAMSNLAKKGAAAAGIAVGASLTKGITSAVTFDTDIREVFTLLPGISQQAMDQMKDQVLDLNNEFGAVSSDTIPALYDALSAGVPQGNVFEFLEVSQRLATAGATDVSTSVDGLTTVVNAFGLQADDAGKVADVLFSGVKAGKTTIDELSASLFQVAPIASTLGVPIEDVTAGFATLTAQGVPTAQAATQMKAAMVALTKPTDAMQETFKKFTGQTAEDFLKSGGSMAEAFDVLNEATGGNVGELTKMLGSVEAVQAVLGTSGGNAEAMAANLEAMANSAGAVDTAFEVMDSGIGATWDKIRARATSGLINLGEQFFPIIQKALDTIIVHGPLVRAEVMRIGTQVWEAIQPILAVIVGFVRDVAVPAFLSFSAWMTETGLPAARAFALEVQQRMQPVIERIAAFVVGTLIPNFRALVEWIRDQGIPGFMAGVAALRDHLQPTFQAVAGFVQNGLMPAFRAIANFISTTVVPVAMRLFGVFINNILPTLANLASFLLVNVVPAFLAVATIITGKIIPLVLRLAGAVIPKLMTVFEVMATVATTAFNVVLAVARPVLDVITKVIDGIASIDLSNIPGAGLLGDIGGAIFGADGGVFTQATNAIIGEAGPEILLPLTRPKRMVEIMNAAGGPVLQALAEDGGSTQPRNRRDGSSGGDRTYNIYGVDANDVVVEIERNDRDLAGAGF